ncbi:uncharacterized protein [Ptychodera flava]|uniref:uncharacterized protein n=1 Tax=Ptychodera flava TaxID=63121 RepID=UPI003969F85A
MWRVILSTLMLQLAVYRVYSISPMIGVDCKNKLVTRSSMLGSWAKVGGSCCIESIGVLKDNTLIGVAEDNQLYTKASPNVGDWEGPMPDSCCVQDIAVMPDGSLLGVTRDQLLVTRPWTRTTVESGWEEVPHSKGVVAVDVYATGEIVGVTKQGTLKIRDGLDSKWKTLKTEGLKVKDIAIQPNGILFGVGKKSNSLHVLDSEGVWGQPIPDTDCVMSIVSVSNLDVYEN